MYFCGSADWKEMPNASWNALAIVDGPLEPPSDAHPATPTISLSILVGKSTMRAIQGVCMRCCHALACTVGLSSFSLVQTHAPSLIVALMTRLWPPTHRNYTRLDRGGGSATAGQGDGGGGGRTGPRGQNCCYLRCAAITAVLGRALRAPVIWEYWTQCVPGAEIKVWWKRGGPRQALVSQVLCSAQFPSLFQHRWKLLMKDSRFCCVLFLPRPPHVQPPPRVHGSPPPRGEPSPSDGSPPGGGEPYTTPDQPILV